MAGAHQATDGAPATYRGSSFWLDDLVASGLDDLRPARALDGETRGSTSRSSAAA